MDDSKKRKNGAYGKSGDPKNHVLRGTAGPAGSDGGLSPGIDDRRKMEEKYRSIFENSLTAMAIVEKDGIISGVNGAFEQISGFPRGEVEGKKSLRSFLTDAALFRFDAPHGPLPETAGMGGLPFETSFTGRGGNRKDLMARVARVSGGEAQIVSMLDITSLKTTQRTLRESRRKFKSLSESAPDIIYTIDTEGCFSYVNPAWSRVLGHPRDEVIGKAIFDFVCAADLDSFHSYFARILNDRKTIQDATAKLRHKDGTSRIFNVCAAPYIDTDGRVAGIVGIFKDITEHRKLEEQLRQAQKMEAVGTLGGGIAHNFNNLLMGILGNTSLLRMKIDPDSPLHEKLQNIEQYVQDGTNLTGQLLGFARSGKYKVRTEDPNTIVEKTARMFGLTHREITVHSHYVENGWKVSVDRAQIEQVLLNIYVNAFQAMPGGGSLDLTTENIHLSKKEVRPFNLPPGRYVRLSVTDTGHGMDPAVQERIFEPFFTTKEKGQGTGLGLSSAYGIVKNHGGFINVYSVEGVGTTFNVYLPAVDRAPEVEQQPDDRLRRGNETVLLIDDEQMILEVATGFLRELGYRVLVASSAKTGIDLFKAHRNEIDLVILDMVMPDMGGGEAFDHLRRIDPQVRILLASGYSLNRQIKNIQRKGCQGFIQKPFNLLQFSIKLREVLEQGPVADSRPPKAAGEC